GIIGIHVGDVLGDEVLQDGSVDEPPTDSSLAVPGDFGRNVVNEASLPLFWHRPCGLDERVAPVAEPGGGDAIVDRMPRPQPKQGLAVLHIGPRVQPRTGSGPLTVEQAVDELSAEVLASCGKWLTWV